MSDQQNRSDTKEAERFIGVLHSKMQYTKTDRKDTVTGFVYSSSSSSSFFFFRNLFTHGALRSSLELVETCQSVPDRIQVLQKTLGWTDYQIFLTYGASPKTNRHKKSNAYRIPPEGL